MPLVGIFHKFPAGGPLSPIHCRRIEAVVDVKIEWSRREKINSAAGGYGGRRQAIVGCIGRHLFRAMQQPGPVCGMVGLELSQLANEQVEVGVADLGIVERVVPLVVVGDPLAQPLGTPGAVMLTVWVEVTEPSGFVAVNVKVVGSLMTTL